MIDLDALFYDITAFGKLKLNVTLSEWDNMSYERIKLFYERHLETSDLLKNEVNKNAKGR